MDLTANGKFREEQIAELDLISTHIFGMPRSQALTEGICLNCKTPITIKDKLNLDYMSCALCYDCYSKKAGVNEAIAIGIIGGVKAKAEELKNKGPVDVDAVKKSIPDQI